VIDMTIRDMQADVFTLIKLCLTLDEIKQRWMVSARHRDEAASVSSTSTNFSELLKGSSAGRCGIQHLGCT
jgi:hypothetical protein